MENVEGLRLTSFPSLKTDLHNAGAEWVDEEVVVDGNLVTSRKTDDIPAFNREMIKLIKEAVPASQKAYLSCFLRHEPTGQFIQLARGFINWLLVNEERNYRL